MARPARYPVLRSVARGEGKPVRSRGVSHLLVPLLLVFATLRCGESLPEDVYPADAGGAGPDAGSPTADGGGGGSCGHAFCADFDDPSAGGPFRGFNQLTVVGAVTDFVGMPFTSPPNAFHS